MRFLILTLLLAASAAASAQAGLVDVVYLTDGSVVRGTITEMTGQSVRLQTGDGSVFVFEMPRVSRIAREAAGAPPSAAVPPAVQQPVYAPQPVYTPAQPAYGAAPAYGPSGVRPPAKNPTTGLLFGAIFPGGGHLYSGETSKGLMVLGASVAAVTLPGIIAYNSVDDCFSNPNDCNSSVGSATTVLYVGYAAALGVWAYSMLDGRNAVTRYNTRVGAAPPQYGVTVLRAPGGGAARLGLSASLTF